MKYHCGHYGCDICGIQQCNGGDIRHFKYGTASFEVCQDCVRLAISFAVNAAQTFGGMIIDASRKCGDVAKKDEKCQIAKT